MISTTPDNTETMPRSEAYEAYEAYDDITVDAPEHRPPDRSGGRRLLYAAALGLALVAVAGAAFWWITSEITVEIAVDGQTQPVDTRADTVGELLAAQEIAVADGDFVSPSVDTELAEGQAVTVRHARPLVVTIDGTETEHTTTELTLGAALAALDAPVEGSALSAPLDQALPLTGGTVSIVTPKSVTIDDGGTAKTITSTDMTVEELLATSGISLTDTDEITPAATTAVTEGLDVTITRIRVETEVRTEAIAHETTKKDDGDLTVGTTKVATEGVDGSKDVTYEITYTNGEITNEEAVSSLVTKEPVTEVIRVGTKPKPQPVAAPAASSSSSSSSSGSASASSGGLNWAGLAKCESGGNPRAVNPAGYYGLYQFDLRTWASVGGSGNPIDASAAEQTKRAQILYDRRGSSPWPHCGRYL